MLNGSWKRVLKKQLNNQIIKPNSIILTEFSHTIIKIKLHLKPFDPKLNERKQKHTQLKSDIILY